ncbi:MAG: thioredoxin fold domain-containing protein [Gammaproteobacteria bacterium]|nr:thioredoxin fold domain-containing protein [Gammaproteobacteria bacterium]
MRWITGFLLLMLCLGTGQPVFAAGGGDARLDPGMVNPGYHEKPDWFKNSFLDIREDLAEAANERRRVLLYFYQDGCPYCAKLLKDNFGNREIVAKTRSGFDAIAINMWGDREVIDLRGAASTEKRFAEALRVQYTPTLLFLNEAGDVVLRINGYFAPHKLSVALDFVAGKHERLVKFPDYYAQMAPVAANATVKPLAASLAKPLQLDVGRTTGRPLLVLFEQGGCGECDELHDEILSQPEVAYALTNLDVAQVDLQANRPLVTPDGRQLSSSAWTRELNILYAPSLVFFDAQGNEVFRTEAYLRRFHVHGAIDYVVSGAYRRQPSFQRFLQHRTEVLAARGLEVDLMR